MVLGLGFEPVSVLLVFELSSPSLLPLTVSLSLYLQVGEVHFQKSVWSIAESRVGSLSQRLPSIYIGGVCIMELVAMFVNSGCLPSICIGGVCIMELEAMFVNSGWRSGLR